MRTATARVGDNRVETVGRELIDILAGQALREFPFAIMRVQRATAVLVRGRMHFTTIAGEHLNRIAVHIAKD